MQIATSSPLYFFRECLFCKHSFRIEKHKGNHTGRYPKFCSDDCRNKYAPVYFKTQYDKRKDTPEYKAYRKNYTRHNLLPVNGKRVVVRKRPFKGKCELCGRKIKGRPLWHHWDNEHPEWGLWVDDKCHRVCEAVEYDPMNELSGKYKRYKFVTSAVEI